MQAKQWHFFQGCLRSRHDGEQRNDEKILFPQAAAIYQLESPACFSVVSRWKKNVHRFFSGQLLILLGCVMQSSWCPGQETPAPPVDLAPPPLTVESPPLAPSSVIDGPAFAGLPLVAQPLWTRYALSDALFWGRDNQSINRPLIVGAGNPDDVRLSTQDLQFPFSEGVRAFYGSRNPDLRGWEVGYFGVYGQFADAMTSTTPPDFIQFPPPIGNVLTADAESAVVTYASTVNSAEINVFSTTTELLRRTGGWLTVDWLAGFRYIGLEEDSSIVTECCLSPTSSIFTPYRVRTRNNAFGGQIGARGRLTWDRWAFESWAKAGILGNAQKQIQDPLIDYTGFQQRAARSATGSEVSFVGDINLSAIYRLTEVWGIRAGYNLFWFTGAALAPDQFDFANTTTAGTGLVSGGGLFMHGANLGLEARW
jgi:hypothetical protein